MTLVPITDLLADAAQAGYAVGYFESWNLESLLAVADAAEATRSPVILGFSGIYQPDPARLAADPLSAYAALGLDICRSLKPPTCLLFNESPYMEAVKQAIDLGFSAVMFSDDALSYAAQTAQVTEVVKMAHTKGVAVEGEDMPLVGVGGELSEVPTNLRLSDPERACQFIEATGIDVLAVNIGQVHLHGRRSVRLDLKHLAKLRKVISIPLVLHGATSVQREDLQAAIQLGISKINVGSLLKRTYFEAVREAANRMGSDYNPYEVLGSGRANDVMMAGRLSLQKTVEDLMGLFGSRDKA